MDSQDYVNYSSSQQPSNYTIPSQFSNQFNPLNIPFQPLCHFDPTNGSYPSHVDQQYGHRFSFQNLLNAPIGNTQTRDTTKSRKKRVKDIQNSDNLQSSLAKKDWSKEEEVALTKAYLYISVDADVGNNQKGAAMWDRILEVWKENMGTDRNAARNNNSLQIKWGKIQSAVSKFNSQYDRLDRHPQSGTNKEDLRMNAMRSYEDLYGTPFRFIHCWEILIKNPKWCAKELTKTSASSKQNVEHNNSTVTGETISNLGDDVVASDSTNPDGVARPQGRKNCKEKKRKLNEEKNIVDALNKLQCSLEKQINVNLASLEMKRENEEKELRLQEEVMKKEIELKEKAQKLKEEAHIMKMREQRRQAQDRFMNQDLSKLSPELRASYEVKRGQILEEWESDGLFGSNMGM